MGLPKIIQIPCHHVLSNQNPLKLKKRAPFKQFFNINLGIGIIKKLLFCSYFRHISLCFYWNFDQESSLDIEVNSASNEYPLSILLMDPASPKKRNTWKKKAWRRWWCHHQIFSFMSCFWGRGVSQKYTEWVLIGCEI